jgi:hypothetical protein
MAVVKAPSVIDSLRQCRQSNWGVFHPSVDFLFSEGDVEKFGGMCLKKTLNVKECYPKDGSFAHLLVDTSVDPLGDLWKSVPVSLRTAFIEEQKSYMCHLRECDAICSLFV